jgi:hypothetical protein
VIGWNGGRNLNLRPRDHKHATTLAFYPDRVDRDGILIKDHGGIDL